MPLKIITNKTYLENMNGSKNFGEFNINYDSNRDKNKEVKASFNTNGKKYYVEDSLQKFLNNIPNSKGSIFDLLKTELHESKKNNNNTNNINLSVPRKYMKIKNVIKSVDKNVTRKNFKENIRASRGITSKLFDYEEDELPTNYNDKIHKNHVNHVNHVTKKLKRPKKKTRKIKTLL